MIKDQDKKIKEMIIYISSKCAGDPTFGKTKLNKILYYCDFLFYKKHRQSISGCEYQKKQFGPVPKNMDNILSDMISKNDIAIAFRQYVIYNQQSPVALREPDLSVLDQKMISFIDGILYTIDKAGYNGSDLSELSHKQMGWEATNIGDTIPFQTIFVKPVDKQIATERNIKQGKRLVSYFKGEYGIIHPTA